MFNHVDGGIRNRLKSILEEKAKWVIKSKTKH
jgi:hypothetical protein